MRGAAHLLAVPEATLNQGTDRIRTVLSTHRQFLLILALFAAFRFSAVWVFKPGGYLGEMSDFGYYRLLQSFSNQGFYPLIDFWVEYPPIFPWLVLGIYRLSLLIPAWTVPGTWFYLLLSTFLVAIEMGNLTALYAIARRLQGPERAVRLAWIYSVLLVPVLTLMGWYDSLALLFLLLAVLWTLDRRPIATGIAAGLGLMTKLVPIVALPSAWQHLRAGRQRLKLVLGTLLTVLLVAAPFLAIAPDMLIQSMKTPLVRSTWETAWALIDGYYSYGVAGGLDRFDPAMAGAAQHPTRLPWLAISIGFALFYAALFTRRVDWTDAKKVVAFTALGQNLLTLYFKGYSPQFLVMLLPFTLLLIPGWRGVAYAVLLSVINLAEYPVYFLVLPDQTWLLTGTVLLRTLILVVVSLEYAGQVYGWRTSQQRWGRLAAGVTCAVVAAALLGSVWGFRAYSAARLQANPHKPAIEALREQAEEGARVVVAEMDAYEQVYPYLRKQAQVSLLETYDYLPPWEQRLADATSASPGQFWLYARAGSPLHTWLAERYSPFADYQFDTWRLTGWRIR